jgi:hypothetical protein
MAGFQVITEGVLLNLPGSPQCTRAVAMSPKSASGKFLQPADFNVAKKKPQQPSRLAIFRNRDLL